MKKLIIVFFVLTCATNIFAAKYDCYINGIYYNLNQSNMTATVTNKTGNEKAQSYSGSVVIPSSITYKEQTYSVTTIGYKAFRNCSGLTSVTIPNSVTTIGYEAFRNCSGLTSVNIPNSVTKIGDYTFKSCSGLTSVNIPNSVTTIGYEAFYNCSGLTSVTIPNSVTKIGDYTFKGCSGLTSVTIPNSVTTIGYEAFRYCNSLTSVTIPNSVTKIGGYAFYNCSKLTSVTIGNSVTTIGSSAFSSCSSLTSVTIPNSVTTIGYEAFRDCNSLTSVTIPNSVTKIGGYAFYNCSKLTSVTIPKSVTTIENYAFNGCSSLTSVTINSNAICKTSNIGTIFGSQVKEYIIGDSVTKIGDYTFYNCSGLTSVTIPNSVTTIGYEAFYNCSGLTSVTIPNSVTTIGYEAFYNCSGLTSVTIPNSVTAIGSYAFRGCSGLKDVYILSDSIQIGNNADYHVFAGCTIDNFYCGKSVNLTMAGGTIKNIHRLSEEELPFYAPFSMYAQEYIESRVNEWQQKGKYEKTVDWRARVNEATRKAKVEDLFKEAQKNYLEPYSARQKYNFTFVTYDPDNEVCLIKETNLGDLLVPVAIADAPYVEQNWLSYTVTPHYAFAGTEIYVESVDFTFPNKKTYTYKANQKLTYATADINYNFAPIELPEMQTVTTGGAVASTQQGINSLKITTPFNLTPMSSVLASYKNIFGKYEMPDKDVRFPYVVIRVTLSGAPQLVHTAKQSLALDLGQSYITEQTVPMEDKILFLVPTGVKNIYLTDGNGQRQLIYSGRLVPNTIYDGVIKVQ